jgi:hypothetical protein
VATTVRLLYLKFRNFRACFDRVVPQVHKARQCFALGSAPPRILASWRPTALPSAPPRILAVRGSSQSFHVANPIARPAPAPQLADLGECSLALRSSAFGNFLSPQPDGRMHAVPSARGSWEWLTLVPVPGPGRKVALRTAHGAYLSVAPSGDIGSAPHLREWEQIAVEAHAEDGTVSFKSFHGTYLCVERGGEGAFVVWNRQRVGAWEKFVYELAR